MAHPLRKYQVQSSMVCDFDKKEKLLQKKYPEVTPAEYYQAIFGADYYGKTHIAFFAQNTAKKTLKFVDFEELFVAAGGRSDAYIAPCEFWGNYRSKKTLNKLYAITIDLDHVDFVDLRRLINAKFCGLVPTMINHSGGGVHLVYVLALPINEECHPDYQPQIEALFSAIRDVFRRPLHSRGRDYPVKYKVDNVSIVQQYRIVGSCTKLGFRARAYRTGGVWDVEKLAEIMGVSWEKCTPVNDEWRKNYVKSNAQHRKNVHEWYRTRGEAPAKVAYIDRNETKSIEKSAKKGLWVYCERRMCDVPMGSRHSALFALCVVAYKCGIDKAVLIDRLEYWRDYYNRRDRDKVRDNEVTTALDGYDRKWARVSAGKLEEWFGWQFDRKTKRNGRTQTAHIQKIADDKTEKAKARIAAFLAENPDASMRKVAEALGMSRNTVKKYYV